MIIGTFRSAEDGFIGAIRTLSMNCPGVAVIPNDEGPEFLVLMVNDKDTTTVELGTAWQRRGKGGGYIEFRLDCPALGAPIVAQMSVTPNKDGVYELKWSR